MLSLTTIKFSVFLPDREICEIKLPVKLTCLTVSPTLEYPPAWRSPEKSGSKNEKLLNFKISRYQIALFYIFM